MRLVAGGLEVSVGTRVWASLGARVVWLSLDPSSAFAPNAGNAFEPEVATKLGVTLPLSAANLSVALGVRAYAESHDVRVNGASALRVPLFAPVLSIEYRFIRR